MTTKTKKSSQRKYKKEYSRFPQRRSKKNKGQILLAHWEGRFGNRMHQYAYGAHYAKKFNLDFILPSDWEGSFLFQDQPHIVLEDDDLRLKLNQPSQDFNKHDWRYKSINEFSHATHRNMVFLNPDSEKECWSGLGNVWFNSLCAYSPWIYKNMSLNYMKNELFKISDEVKKLDVYKFLEDKQGTYDIAHLRRDDISSTSYNSNYGYSVLSKDCYEKAFKKFGFDPEKIEWTSDDWTGNWGVGKPSDNKWFKRRGGWRYPEGSEVMPEVGFDWLPDWLRIYFARNVFRANSSFSWWACCLGNQKKVYAPILDKREIYSGRKGSGLEIEVEFVESNEPHWLVLKGQPCEKIVIPNK